MEEEDQGTGPPCIQTRTQDEEEEEEESESESAATAHSILKDKKE